MKTRKEQPAKWEENKEKIKLGEIFFKGKWVVSCQMMQIKQFIKQDEERYIDNSIMSEFRKFD